MWAFILICFDSVYPIVPTQTISNANNSLKFCMRINTQGVGGIKRSVDDKKERKAKMPKYKLYQ